jgi:hypothetical protein
MSSGSDDAAPHSAELIVKTARPARKNLAFPHHIGHAAAGTKTVSVHEADFVAGRAGTPRRPPGGYSSAAPNVLRRRSWPGVGGSRSLGSTH